MNKQNFTGISSTYKNRLVKFAKKNGFRFDVNKRGSKQFDVIIYCSSEAMEDSRF